VKKKQQQQQLNVWSQELYLLAVGVVLQDQLLLKKVYVHMGGGFNVANNQGTLCKIETFPKGCEKGVLRVERITDYE